MTDPDRRVDLRKGWCPGALRPMAARDGLLVRLRITAGIVRPETAGALAGLAETHGNGLFDLSGRANLQMRGVREEALPALLDGLRRLDLLDADAEREAVRNVLASPLAGLGDRLDVRPLVAALEARLTAQIDLHALPSKFGFLIDDGGDPTLAEVPADVRFDWIAGERMFAVGLGGTRRDSAFAGHCVASGVVDRAAAIARVVAGLQDGPPRRMRALLRDLGAARSAALFGVEARSDQERENATRSTTIVGLRTFGDIEVLGLGAPFGRLDSAMVRTAAQMAAADGGTLRLTPWRALLVPYPAAGIARAKTADRLAAAASVGLIVDPTDPRLRVAACVGVTGCERGTTATHADASALADLAEALGDEPTPLHVSGCEKGCAKPAASAITLVGRNGRYDLVRGGRPGDAPALHALDLAGVRAALTHTQIGTAVDADRLEVRHKKRAPRRTERLQPAP